MNKLILTLFALLLIGNVIAVEQCKITADIKDAYETIETIIKVPVMENKVITTQVRTPVNVSYTAKVPDNDKWKIDLRDYQDKLTQYKSKQISIIPKYPVMTYVNKTFTRINYTTTTTEKTIKVPKVQNKTTYYINWLALKIESKTTQIPVYETQTETTNKLKKGYSFNSDTGEFYTEVKC
jgi:hypothetical protein